MWIRQGDVNLFKVDDRPVSGTPKEVVLAVGSTSNHCHVVDAIEILEWEKRYIHVAAGAVLRIDGDPDRHAPIPFGVPVEIYDEATGEMRTGELPAGLWEVVGEREFGLDEIREISD